MCTSNKARTLSKSVEQLILFDSPNSLLKKSIRCIKLKQMRHTSYYKKIETLQKEG